MIESNQNEVERLNTVIITQEMDPDNAELYKMEIKANKEKSDELFSKNRTKTAEVLGLNKEIEQITQKAKEEENFVKGEDPEVGEALDELNLISINRTVLKTCEESKKRIEITTKNCQILETELNSESEQFNELKARSRELETKLEQAKNKFEEMEGREVKQKEEIDTIVRNESKQLETLQNDNQSFTEKLEELKSLLKKKEEERILILKKMDSLEKISRQFCAESLSFVDKNMKEHLKSLGLLEGMVSNLGESLIENLDQIN